MREIERKFLVDLKKWEKTGDGIHLIQGYLSVDPERTVRVRLYGNEAFLTIKGKSKGISRTELEYEIPLDEAAVLMKMCLDNPIEKIRYRQEEDGLIWEIDVFEGENKGLVMAEVELESESQQVVVPAWIQKEVSGDKHYFNSWLSKHPYIYW